MFSVFHGSNTMDWIISTTVFLSGKAKFVYPDFVFHCPFMIFLCQQHYPAILINMNSYTTSSAAMFL